MLKTNDHHAIAELAEGTLTTDAHSGTVFRNGKPATKPNGRGYVIVPLRNHRTIVAHRVVWIDAYGPIAPGLVVNHRNGVRSDNRLVNLEAITQRQNVLHATGSHQYVGIRPSDIDAVDPSWLAEMLRRAAAGQPPPERGSGPADFAPGRALRKYAY